MTGRGLPTARWHALGSIAVVRVAEPWQLEPAILAVRATLERFDRVCSRFRADSELTSVNARAGRPVEVSPLMADAVEIALRGAALTDGTLDPCLGRSLEQAGYDRDWELVRERQRDRDDVLGGDEEHPSASRLVARRRAAWRDVEVDRTRGTVQIPAGAKLDLGATAKALAADRAAAAVHASSGHGVLVALGGDLAAAGRSPSGGWRVHVTDDHRAGPRAPGQRVAIEDGGLATSSTTTRSWRRGGETMHHIIDPVTGRPAVTRWRTVSVAATDCTDANIASTTAILRDGEAIAWLERHGLPARLVELDGTVHTVAGWPAEQLAPPPAVEA
ncbi:MAG: FAD:protein transferase [Solirubrobacteraceae bacterium]|jgi:thiamine biosynthesis lipoprotein|nr:FAD:protein transferase [Solirubrobacterales bacterium]MEA2215895.1 FAD:protein transferase [Solirubrobacteraceae bacterium]